MQVVGEIQGDGSFTLRTVKGESKGVGVPEGEYQVVVQIAPTVTPGADPVAARKAIPLPITLPDRLKVEAKENSFKIDLPTAAPK